MLRTLIGPLVLCIIALDVSIVRADEMAYYVGNSLTHQGTGTSGAGVANLSGQLGHPQSAWASHIRCNSGLHAIWSDPATTCVTPHATYGTFNTALPGYEWSRISLQPYYEPAATSALRIVDLYQLAQSQGRNSSATFYVFQGHPNLGSGSYADAWLGNGDVSRAAMNQIIESVRSHPGIDPTRVFVVPTGDVWLEIDQRISSGLIPGYTSVRDDIYLDDLVHLERVGRWVEGITFAATFYGESPIGLSIPSAYPSFTITAEQKLALEQAVWDVVSTHAYTGVPEPAAIALPMIATLAMLRRRRTHSTSRLPELAPVLSCASER